MIKYQYKNTIYDSFEQVRIQFPNISFPADIKQEDVQQLGITILEDADSEPTLEELKDQKIEDVKDWTASKITGGFASSVTGAPITYDSDTDTQLTMQGIAINCTSNRFALEYPEGCPVRGYEEGCDEKKIFYFTAEMILAWCADLSVHIGTCKQQGWEKQTEVLNAQTKEELSAVTLE